MENRFEEVINQVALNPRKKKCAVVCADQSAVEAVRRAEELGLVQPVFFSLEGADSPPEALCFSSAQEAARQAVLRVGQGDLDMILKGNLDTAVLLKEIVNKDYGLLTGRLISHVALLDCPRYHKLMLVTDGGMVMYPDLEDLQGILVNAVQVMQRLGVDKPKVACLAAVEKVHQRMPETVRAAALKALNEEGQLTGCQVEGPISFDLAFDPEAAAIKHYESPVAGDADIFLMPDFVCGNLTSKALIYGGGARFAGFLAGARAPVIITSRSAGVEEKLYSIACSALVSA